MTNGEFTKKKYLSEFMKINILVKAYFYIHLNFPAKYQFLNTEGKMYLNQSGDS